MGSPQEDKDLESKVKNWLDWDKNEKSREEISNLKASGNKEELKKRLSARMEFGTAGLRARMGTGFSMMNDLTIIQTTQGLLKYLESACSDLKERGVVVGFDGRHNSRRFAWLTAAIFMHAGVKVYLFSNLCPTPYVAYGVRKFQGVCGVMVTASHNPKEDNGYKVYGRNGAQIISPVDQHISDQILANLEPWASSWNTDIVDTSPLRSDPLQETLVSYNKDVKELICFSSSGSDCPIKFTYTAMHGVGYEYVKVAMKAFSFSEPVPVKEQVEPDPEFPTVKYPNPEEGKGALLLAMKTADEAGSPVILANDPDADRLAVAEKVNGEWKIFTGNELGALFGWWAWFSFKHKNPNTTGSDVYMLASTVSSKILGAIAKKEGFNFEETLTGFKWMGNRADELEESKKTVLFAFEEAIGFMCGTKVLDKDGVSALCAMAEMASYLYAKEKITLTKQLDNVYQKYGFHLSSNSYFICHEQETIKQLFDNLRNYKDSKEYPSSCGPYEIKYVRDLTTGYDNSFSDCKPRLPVSSSQMITFTFKNGCVATLRTSGTEPKIKYYTEYCVDPTAGLERHEAEEELKDVVNNIRTHFFQPDKYGLIPQSG
ncbi:phosphopentomutase-like [Liolophura sinensis]|uniref:phosphopentomutase-like n=1 Tax=Liolophura sinensis TaxID=3198878 RepID=UPI003159763D